MEHNIYRVEVRNSFTIEADDYAEAKRKVLEYLLAHPGKIEITVTFLNSFDDLKE